MAHEALGGRLGERRGPAGDAAAARSSRRVGADLARRRLGAAASADSTFSTPTTRAAARGPGRRPRRATPGWPAGSRRPRSTSVERRAARRWRQVRPMTPVADGHPVEDLLVAVHRLDAQAVAAHQVDARLAPGPAATRWSTTTWLASADVGGLSRGACRGCWTWLGPHRPRRGGLERARTTIRRRYCASGTRAARTPADVDRGARRQGRPDGDRLGARARRPSSSSSPRQTP